MKKTVALLLAGAFALALMAHGFSEGMTPSEPAQARADAGRASEEAPSTRILVAYFSWADNAALAADVDAVSSPSVLAPGNVQQLAEWVQAETGGELFPIRVAEPYPSDWDECLARANQERGDDARPALVAGVEDLDEYDTVFLGYPNWWYGVPMALLTFLDENDLSGKQVYLFCSHGTGGLARSVDMIAEAAPDALISGDVFDCYEEDAASSQSAIRSWIAELGCARAEQSADAATAVQLSVTWAENQVLYALNDSPAARSLLEQLPLTLEVEDYGDNEKIFYPPRQLDTADTPAATGGAGTLAYYAPWGDVVMFYGDYRENPALFELGRVVSGAELVSLMRGTLTLTVAE